MTAIFCHKSRLMMLRDRRRQRVRLAAFAVLGVIAFAFGYCYA